MEARICDRTAGSRGSLLLRLRRVALEQGSGDGVKVSLSNEGARAHGRIHSRSRSRSRSVSPARPATVAAGGGSTAGGWESVGTDDGSGRQGASAGAQSRSSVVGGDGGRAIEVEAEVEQGAVRGVGSASAGVGRAGDGGSAKGFGVGALTLSDTSDADESYDSDSDSGSASGSSSGSSTDIGNNRSGFGFGFGSGGGGSDSFSRRNPRGAATHDSAASTSFAADGIDLTADYMAGGDGGSYHRADEDSNAGSVRPVTRATSDGSVWASRGGVPPNLDLLPGEGLDGGLASLGEGSGDESGREGRASPEAVPSGRIKRPEGSETASHVVENVAGGADSAKVGGAIAEGRDEVGDSEHSGDDERRAHREVGSGRWDEHLDAITRAAWLGSKAASCRGFNSNASSASAGSTSLTAVSATAVAAAGNAHGSHRSYSGSDSHSSTGRGRVHVVRRTKPFPPTYSSLARAHTVPGDHASPSTAAAAVSTATGVPSVVPTTISRPSDEVAGDVPPAQSRSLAEDVPSGERRSARAGAEATAERAGGRETAGEVVDGRVAGSGFLYRVVFDGLNVLITLKLR